MWWNSILTRTMCDWVLRWQAWSDYTEACVSGRWEGFALLFTHTIATLLQINRWLGTKSTNKKVKFAHGTGKDINNWEGWGGWGRARRASNACKIQDLSARDVVAQCTRLGFRILWLESTYAWLFDVYSHWIFFLFPSWVTYEGYSKLLFWSEWKSQYTGQSTLANISTHYQSIQEFECQPALQGSDVLPGSLNDIVFAEHI